MALGPYESTLITELFANLQAIHQRPSSYWSERGELNWAIYIHWSLNIWINGLGRVGYGRVGAPWKDGED